MKEKIQEPEKGKPVKQSSDPANTDKTKQIECPKSLPTTKKPNF